MIDKIRKTFKSVNEIEDIKNKLASAKKEIEDIKESLVNIEKGMKEKSERYEKENKVMLEEKRKAIDVIKSVGVDFQKELNDFKTLKNKLQTEIVNQVARDIRKEMNIYIMNIKQKIDSLNNAAKDIENISSNSAKTMESIDKLRAISSEIKKEDFELVKYAHELHNNDKEKLNLMRKIDVLERLIAKQRRSPR